MRGEFPTLRAYRRGGEKTQPVQLRVKQQDHEADPVMRVRFRDPTEVRPRPRSFAPAFRRIAVAGTAAAIMLFVGIRYTGFFSNEYGRDVAPLLNNLIRDFVPSEKQDEQKNRTVVPSRAYGANPLLSSGPGPAPTNPYALKDRSACPANTANTGILSV